MKCVNKCNLDRRTRRCKGCNRTMEEIEDAGRRKDRRDTKPNVEANPRRDR